MPLDWCCNEHHAPSSAWRPNSSHISENCDEPDDRHRGHPPITGGHSRKIPNQNIGYRTGRMTHPSKDSWPGTASSWAPRNGFSPRTCRAGLFSVECRGRPAPVRRNHVPRTRPPVGRNHLAAHRGKSCPGRLMSRRRRRARPAVAIAAPVRSTLRLPVALGEVFLQRRYLSWASKGVEQFVVEADRGQQ
jgi:hypothetical protein